MLSLCRSHGFTARYIQATCFVLAPWRGITDLVRLHRWRGAFSYLSLYQAFGNRDGVWRVARMLASYQSSGFQLCASARSNAAGQAAKMNQMIK
jgi:hypothetical protein